MQDRNQPWEIYGIYDGNEEPPCDSQCRKIFIQTRSILQILVIMSLGIELPPDCECMPRVVETKLPEEQPIRNFKVHSSKEYPRNAFVAVKYCGTWYYIDNRDFNSKIIFSSILGVLSMAEPNTSAGVPILTLPVQ